MPTKGSSMRKVRHFLFRLFQKRFLFSNKRHIRQLEKLHIAHQGKPFIYDDEHLRFLYFSQTCMQSVMNLNAPDDLVFAYTRDMMGFLLHNPAPRHILMIGLGGGSLVKFCHRFLPDCRITVVEICADVLALRDQFMLPADDDRLEIIHDDAINYLQKTELSVDVILLDGFTIDGLASELNTAKFYASCHRALKPEGILVANFWGKRKILTSMIQLLRKQFAYNTWWCRASDCYNLVVFCLKGSCSSFKFINVNRAYVGEQAMALHLNELHQRLQTIPAGAQRIDATIHKQNIELDLLDAHLKEIIASDKGVPANYMEWKAQVKRR